MLYVCIISRPPPQHNVCANCATTTTPLWRKDRASNTVLCNACGIYLKTHGRARPIDGAAKAPLATPPAPAEPAEALARGPAKRRNSGALPDQSPPKAARTGEDPEAFALQPSVLYPAIKPPFSASYYPTIHLAPPAGPGGHEATQITGTAPAAAAAAAPFLPRPPPIPGSAPLLSSASMPPQVAAAWFALLLAQQQPPQAPPASQAPQPLGLKPASPVQAPGAPLAGGFRPSGTAFAAVQEPRPAGAAAAAVPSAELAAAEIGRPRSGEWLAMAPRPDPLPFAFPR